ncbi:MAG: NADH-quinone oxidoreductase subunit NuoH [Bacteroidota bacterium]
MDFVIILAKIAFVLAGVLTGAAVCVFVERKVSAYIQNRIGPNRVGPGGWFQAIADVGKLVMKEDIVPANANKVIHDLAPVISVTVAMSTFAVIPFGNTIELFGQQIKLIVADVNVGILYILAMTGMGVYGVTLAGWSSNNKYSLLGGLRSSAQLISYELSMGISLIGVLLMAGSVRLDQIVVAQSGYWGGWLPRWNIFPQFFGCVTFLVASFAETNRLPFDLPEAEPELVGGYHTEYTGMKFGLFMLSEYMNLITSSAIIVTLFLGGWTFPYIENIGFSPLIVSLLQIGAFVFKVVCVIFFYMVIRWTLPRFRYDQLMNLGWKVMLPLSIVNFLVTGLVMLLLS